MLDHSVLERWLPPVATPLNQNPLCAQPFGLRLTLMGVFGGGPKGAENPIPERQGTDWWIFPKIKVARTDAPDRKGGVVLAT